MENKQDKYIKNLMQQFINSKGIKNIDINSRMFKQEFVMWIDEMNNLSEGYIQLLNLMGIPYDNSEMVEIGKGKYDSVVLNNGSTILLTPYITEKVNNPICNYEFTVSDKKPAVVKDGKSRILSIQNIMTHNPYTEADIYNWEQLHNNDSCQVTIGIYGKNNDKDKNSKIKLLEQFKKELYIGFNEDNYEANGNYYYSITSHGKTLKKFKR